MRTQTVLILALLHLIGAVLMGFEMLGSRYLNPYFGSGVNTWACLISVVLVAMMLGYYAGGVIADRARSVALLGVACILSGLSMAIVPFTADAILAATIDTFGDRFWGTLLGAVFLMFVPVFLISACSPITVRLLLTNVETGGRVTGAVYGISTFGNVLGTLGTTFLLIPNYGVRDITTAFALIMLLLGVLALAMTAGPWRARAAKASLLAAVLGGVTAAAAALMPAGRVEAAPVRMESSYPEGPLFVGDALFVAEMGRDRVVRIDAGGKRGANMERLETFWAEPGCGPTALARIDAGRFLILCHLARKLVVVGADGETVAEVTENDDGRPFQDPNDVTSDARGGAYITDPGLFAAGTPATGAVYHIGADLSVHRIASDLSYPNGVTYREGRLYVAEHLAQRIWDFEVSGARVVSRRVFADLAPLIAGWEVGYREAGPDGLEWLGDKLLAAVYGAGRVVVLGADGSEAGVLPAPARFVTNVAVSSRFVAVVGTHDNQAPPFPGVITLTARADFERLVAGAARP